MPTPSAPPPSRPRSPWPSAQQLSVVFEREKQVALDLIKTAHAANKAALASIGKGKKHIRRIKTGKRTRGSKRMSKRMSKRRRRH